jgi:hypothetical protein
MFSVFLHIQKKKKKKKKLEKETQFQKYNINYSQQNNLSPQTLERFIVPPP